MGASKRKKRVVMHEFRDAQQMAHDHPETFWAPPYTETSAVKQGDCVKVCARGERFWVMVIDNDIAAQRFVGTVDNALWDTDSHGLSFGDVVEVEYRHVYDIHLAPDHREPISLRPEQGN